MAWTLQNIMRLPGERPGVYVYFDDKGRALYAGHGSERGVKARLIDAWYRRGDYRTDAVKKEMREKIAKVDIIWGNNIYDNYALEAKLKKECLYNVR